MRALRWFLALCLIGAIDVVLFGGINYDPVACDEVGVTRAGMHQGKTEAWLLYFFIAHVYDAVLNPWHWTDDMREAALSSGGFGLRRSLAVADVGAGTGFTTVGVLRAGVAPGDVMMLDQSQAQLGKARAKPELQGIRSIVEGDAENLPGNWTGKFDRYVSAGSIEYWPHPQQAVDESARILKEGGKAMIIGPIRATNPISRFFADVWYLFPEESEYRAWFTKAGYVDVTISHITPSWYNGDRSHGLIMGCAVVGTKPPGWTPPKRSATAQADASKVAGSSNGEAPWRKVLSVLVVLPRFVLGVVGSLYYTFLPMVMFVKNVYLGGSWLAVAAAVLVPAIVAVALEVYPSDFSPLGRGNALRRGIATLYDESSGVWESVWGEHMHTGFYEDGGDGNGDGKRLTHEDHVAAQIRMMEKLLDKWDNLLGAAREAEADGRPLRILDCGCGVGGSSRFLAAEVAKRALDAGVVVGVEVVGITLSPVQRDRAEALSASLKGTGAKLSFYVLDALDTGLPAGSFDLVWALESGEHMPEKSAWLAEVARLLRPGGVFVAATWCHRGEDGGANPLTPGERMLLGRICKNYALPEFVPLDAYCEASAAAGLEHFAATRESWSDDITPFWPAVLSAALRPTVVLRLLLTLNWTTVRGAATAFLMRDGFASGTLDFGAFAVTKPGGTRRSARSRRASTGRT